MGFEGHGTESATLFVTTFRAATTIVAGVAVKMSDTNTVTLAGNNERAIGIAWGPGASGGNIRVAMPGPIVNCIANAAITLGDSVQSVAATGYVGTAGADEDAIGIALKAATAQGDKIPVLLQFHTVQTS